MGLLEDLTKLQQVQAANRTQVNPRTGVMEFTQPRGGAVGPALQTIEAPRALPPGRVPPRLGGPSQPAGAGQPLRALPPGQTPQRLGNPETAARNAAFEQEVRSRTNPAGATAERRPFNNFTADDEVRSRAKFAQSKPNAQTGTGSGAGNPPQTPNAPKSGNFADGAKRFAANSADKLIKGAKSLSGHIPAMAAIEPVLSSASTIVDNNLQGRPLFDEVVGGTGSAAGAVGGAALGLKAPGFLKIPATIAGAVTGADLGRAAADTAAQGKSFAFEAGNNLSKTAQTFGNAFNTASDAVGNFVGDFQRGIVSDRPQRFQQVPDDQAKLIGQANAANAAANQAAPVQTQPSQQVVQSSINAGAVRNGQFNNSPEALRQRALNARANGEGIHVIRGLTSSISAPGLHGDPDIFSEVSLDPGVEEGRLLFGRAGGHPGVAEALTRADAIRDSAEISAATARTLAAQKGSGLSLGDFLEQSIMGGLQSEDENEQRAAEQLLQDLSLTKTALKGGEISPNLSTERSLQQLNQLLLKVPRGSDEFKEITSRIKGLKENQQEFGFGLF